MLPWSTVLTNSAFTTTRTSPPCVLRIRTATNADSPRNRQRAVVMHVRYVSTNGGLAFVYTPAATSGRRRSSRKATLRRFPSGNERCTFAATHGKRAKQTKQSNTPWAMDLCACISESPASCGGVLVRNLALMVRAQKHFLQAIQTQPPALLLYLPNTTLTAILLISLWRTPRSHRRYRAEG